MPWRMAPPHVRTDAEVAQQCFVVAHFTADAGRKLGKAENRAATGGRHADLARGAVGAAGYIGRRLVGHPEQRRCVAGLPLLDVGRGAVEQNRRLTVGPVAGDEPTDRLRHAYFAWRRRTIASTAVR